MGLTNPFRVTHKMVDDEEPHSFPLFSVSFLHSTLTVKKELQTHRMQFLLYKHPAE